MLYTQEVLALATGLAEFPLDAAAHRIGQARSPTCGSTVEVSLDLEPSGAIARVGMRAQACAIGQASAAIFGRAAVGKNLDELEQADAAIAAWLAGGSLPDWPDLATIATARDYPSRHGAIRLPWRAALASTVAER